MPYKVITVTLYTGCNTDTIVNTAVLKTLPMIASL